MANLHLRLSRLVPLIYDPLRKSCYSPKCLEGVLSEVCIAPVQHGGPGPSDRGYGVVCPPVIGSRSSSGQTKRSSRGTTLRLMTKAAASVRLPTPSFS